MTLSFNPLKANGPLFTHLPELDDLEVSLSNDNAADVLGIEDSFSASPWPLPCFKALLSSPGVSDSATPRPPFPSPTCANLARCCSPIAVGTKAISSASSPFSPISRTAPPRLARPTSGGDKAHSIAAPASRHAQERPE